MPYLNPLPPNAIAEIRRWKKIRQHLSVTTDNGAVFEALGYEVEDAESIAMRSVQNLTLRPFVEKPAFGSPFPKVLQRPMFELPPIPEQGLITDHVEQLAVLWIRTIELSIAALNASRDELPARLKQINYEDVWLPDPSEEEPTTLSEVWFDDRLIASLTRTGFSYVIKGITVPEPQLENTWEQN